MRVSWIVLAAALTAFGAVGCSDTPAAPSHYATFSQTDIVVGDGAEARSGATLTVNYTGWLYNALTDDHKGLQFDSSIGRQPFTFTLGSSQTIQGWDVGLVGMKVGGTRRLVVPPSLAYGASRNQIIPPYATLVFDIQLLSVVEATQ
jgi:FKBP-type peptidyl-prolyl cis-trans isomerase FkpA